LSHSANGTLSIINNKRIFIHDERIRGRGLLVSACIPSDGLCGVRDGLVHGDGVELVVLFACCYDVYGCGSSFQRGVVPAEGDKVADFVVLLAILDGGGDHGNAAGGETGIV